MYRYSKSKPIFTVKIVQITFYELIEFIWSNKKSKKKMLLFWCPKIKKIIKKKLIQ